MNNFIKATYKEDKAYKETYLCLNEISHVCHTTKPDVDKDGNAVEFHSFVVFMHNGTKLNITRETWDNLSKILDNYIE